MNKSVIDCRVRFTGGTERNGSTGRAARSAVSAAFGIAA